MNQPRGDQLVSEASHTRMDAPHPVKTADDLAQVVEESLLSDDSPADHLRSTAADQLINQASQLAGHLRARQRDLDRRESQLNARVASLEDELRTSRLWFAERENEFTQRELELEQRVHELEEQAAAVSAAEAAQEAAAEEDEPVLVPDDQFSDHPPDTDLRLDGPEVVFHQHVKQLQRERQDVARQRQAVELQKERQQQLATDLQRRAEQELADRRQQFEKRMALLDERDAALEQLHAEVSRTHRESLELRLIAEQIWSQLAQRVAPAELTQRLSQARSQLDKYYRSSNEQLARTREELRSMSVKLDQRRDELSVQRSELDDWIANRRQEIELQAACLVRREQQLEEQEQHFRQMAEEWNDERRELQQQIQKLLPRCGPSTATA